MGLPDRPDWKSRSFEMRLSEADIRATQGAVLVLCPRLLLTSLGSGVKGGQSLCRRPGFPIRVNFAGSHLAALENHRSDNDENGRVDQGVENVCRHIHSLIVDDQIGRQNVVLTVILRKVGNDEVDDLEN